MSSLVDKLMHGWPGAEWNWPSTDNYETLEWFGPGEKPTLQEIEAVSGAELPVYRFAIQRMLEARAAERQYDSAISIATYTNSSVPQWAAEAQAFVVWRDAVWAYAYAELERVQNGQRPAPSVEQFLAKLPVLEWPE